MKKMLFIAFALCVFALNAVAQEIEMRMLDKHLYKTRVKLVDEFFDRFNLKELHPDQDPRDSSFKEKCLLSLFDYEYLWANKDSVGPILDGFIREIVDSGIKINYQDTNWFALAKCHGKMKGKNVVFNLVLTVEKRGEEMYKWVIKEAEGEIFALKPAFTNEKLMLMPDDHETNFMSLRRITTERDDIILNYKGKEFETDQTSVFYSLVHYGLLDIDYVSDLQFVFRQVPGYEFSIINLDRETTNAGWLINSLKKVD